MKDTSDGTARIRPRARIMRTIGDELISSESVAVVELIKNAYDADATHVLVRFTGPFEIGKGAFEIIDDGHGMERDVVLTTWLEPATAFKSRQKRSPTYKRRMLGSKGVGRFASAKLGETMLMCTRAKASSGETSAILDWSWFDEDVYLDEIEAQWEQGAPNEFTAGSHVAKLWSEHFQADAPRAGTRIVVEGHRTNWSPADFEKIRRTLARLVTRDSEDLPGGFRVALEVDTPFDGFTGEISPPPVLDHNHYELQCQVDADGNFEMRLGNREQLEPLEGRLTPDSDGEWSCGPFSLTAKVWDRDPASLRPVAKNVGSSLKEVKRDIDEMSGMSVYRDGFRLFPYGEVEDDWLGLDARRIQNPSMRISNNQIVGGVQISADSNPNLVDQSNREGLVENAAYQHFRTAVLECISHLERARFRAKKTVEKSRTTQSGLFEGFGLERLSKVLSSVAPQNEQVESAVRAEQRRLDQQIDRVKAVLGRYQRLATLGTLIDILLHEGRRPLRVITNNAEMALKRAQKLASEPRTYFSLKLGKIAESAALLDRVLRKVEPFSGRKRGRPREVVLEDVVRTGLEALESEIRRAQVEVTVSDGKTLTTVDPPEIQMIVVNMVDNSLYWLSRTPTDQRRIKIDVQRLSENVVELVFSDSGPGVPDTDRDVIFSPYFSGKPEGVGLGLAIVGEVVTDFYGGDVVLLNSGPLPGATFRITLRHRVKATK